MGRMLIDNKTGEKVWQDDRGQILPIIEPGLRAQAYRQFADIGSGAKQLYGELTDQPELANAARRETAARNALFAPADAAYPWQSLIGQGLPGMATAPLSMGSMLGSAALNMTLGAAESALDSGEPGTRVERAIAGGAAGVLGEVGGRVLGRVWNTAKGLANDMRLGRAVAANPKAREAEDLGLALRGSDRAMPNSPEQRTLRKLEDASEASLFTQGLQEANEKTNQQLYKNTALEAVGVNPAAFDDLGADTLRGIDQQLSEQFSNFASDAAGAGNLEIGQELGERILNTRGQVRDLAKRGRFKGLEAGELSGAEWTTARRALAADAANAASRGDYDLAEDIFGDVAELDQALSEVLGPEALENFARLREQYRVFKILSGSGVIKSNGDISIKKLNTRLKGGTGFGTTAQQAKDTVNQESKALIDLARVGSADELAPFKTSGTAEKLGVQRVMGQLLNPYEWAGLAGEAVAPILTGMTSRNGGRAVTGALTPSPGWAKKLGQAPGRSMLDESLYPFVGIEDDRER